MENVKSDSNKYYRVIRELKRTQPKNTLVIKNKEGQFIANPSDQAKEIREFFKSTLAPLDNPAENKKYPPCHISNPFTAREIEKTVNCMKNGKSPGPDNLNAELIKYAPPIVHHEIANLFNQITESDNFPEEIKLGTLTPKPGKPKVQSCS